MRSFKRLFLLTLVILGLLMASAVNAQNPVVFGVFFYSPTCPHCEDVINNHWPGIQSEFSDQLRVLFINVSTAQGSALMRDALTALRIDSTGVPMLIIGSDVLVGSVDIPLRAPQIIRARLGTGGIGLPAIPGIEAIYQRALAQSGQEAAAEHNQAGLATEAAPGLFDRLAADPLANGLAVLVLLLLVVSLISAPFGTSLASRFPIKTLSRALLTLVPLIGLLVSASLIAGWDNQPLVLALAVGEFAVFLILLVVTVRPALIPRAASWRVPLTTIVGLGAAAYLAFIEINQLEAVCGLVGNCNLVQQSPYAQIAGIPIGVIGIVGYIGLLVLWLVGRSPVWLLRAATVFGVAFSIYLTFLEPFVIGATCMWCLTSALIMLLLLWLVYTMPEQRTAN